MDIIQKQINKVIDIESEGLNQLKVSLNEQSKVIDKMVYEIVSCKGLVVWSGLGKSGHIASKISATMSSLGIKSIYLHSAEALHGDLGRVGQNDIVFVLSNGGNTQEVCEMVTQLNKMKVRNIAITSNPKSFIYQHCCEGILLPKIKEACHLGLAPTSSTTVQLVLGDALSVAASYCKGFKENDFAKYHPSGSLGKRLGVYVRDIMHKDENNPVVFEGTLLKDAIVKLSEFGLGAISIVSQNYRLSGLITDGDIKRFLNKNIDIYTSSVNEVMTTSPYVIDAGELASNALSLMEHCGKLISVLPVLDDNRVVGMIRLHDVLQAGV